MSGLISQWAAAYSLPDPAPRANEVFAADSSAAREWAARCITVAWAADGAEQWGRQSLKTLDAGWSTPQAHGELAAWCAGTDRLSAYARSLRGSIEQFASAIDSARAAVQRAYDAADEIIRALGLQYPVLWYASIDQKLLIDRRRSGVVMMVYAVTTAAADQLDAVAAHLTGTMAPDPRLDLPAASPNASPVLQRATRVDATNLAALRRDLASPDEFAREFAEGVRRSLMRARADGRTARLLAYDPASPAGQGSVAIAIGNLARADSVAVLVPGVNNSPSNMTGLVDLAARLDSAAEAHGSQADTATVLWLGYDIPLSSGDDPAVGERGDQWLYTVNDALPAIDADAASAAAPALGRFVQNLRAVTDPSARLTLIGHSYGSTVVSQVADRIGSEANVDDIVLLGSPGAGPGVEDAWDYTAVSPRHVYTLAFPDDPIAGSWTDAGAQLLHPLAIARGMVIPGDQPGPFGRDPNDQEFDAEVIAAGSNAPTDDFLDLDQHDLGNYLSGESLGAVASVVAGRYGSVPLRKGTR